IKWSELHDTVREVLKVRTRGSDDERAPAGSDLHQATIPEFHQDPPRHAPGDPVGLGKLRHGRYLVAADQFTGFDLAGDISRHPLVGRHRFPWHPITLT